MTELLIHLWNYDPLLVLAGGFILGLLTYLEIMRLRIQLINNALGALGEVIHNNGAGDNGGGCITTLLMLALITMLLLGIYLLAIM